MATVTGMQVAKINALLGPLIESAYISGGNLFVVTHDGSVVNVGTVGGDLSAYAPLASPALTGNPTAPTQTAGNNSTRIATTAFVKTLSDAAIAPLAPLASPALTGNPTAPTQTSTDNSTRLATTAFVKTLLASYATTVSPVFTGLPTAPTQSAGDNSTRLATTAFARDVALNNPQLAGSPTAPTPTGGDNSTKIATTAFITTAISGKANTASPALTGTPTAPSQTASDDSTKIATTEFVHDLVDPILLDSGWVVPTLGTNYAHLNTGAGYQTQYRRYRGFLTLNLAFVKSGATNAIFTLPSGFRPSVVLFASLASSGITVTTPGAGTASVTPATAGVQINTDGTVVASASGLFNASYWGSITFPI